MSGKLGLLAITLCHLDAVNFPQSTFGFNLATKITSSSAAATRDRKSSSMPRVTINLFLTRGVSALFVVYEALAVETLPLFRCRHVATLRISRRVK
jgi:hypothetical protein